MRLELGTVALAREAAALRCGLDATAWDGARTLLVSHWAVYLDATAKLITAAIREMARDAKGRPVRLHGSIPRKGQGAIRGRSVRQREWRPACPLR